jgi:hypothetical protein
MDKEHENIEFCTEKDLKDLKDRSKKAIWQCRMKTVAEVASATGLVLVGVGLLMIGFKK